MIDPSKNIPTSTDTAEVWINWHKALQRWFSKAEANSYWLRFWGQRAGAGAVADTTDLRAYMGEQGVELTTTWSGSVADGVSGVTGWFGDTFTMIRNLFFGAVILVLALIAFIIFSTFRKRDGISGMQGGVRVLPLNNLAPKLINR